MDMVKKIFVVFALFLSVNVDALSESITVSEFDQSLQDALNSGTDLGFLIGERVQSVMNSAGIVLEEDALIYSHDFGSQEIRGGCTANVKLKQAHATVRVDGDSEFSFIVDALSEPIVASVDVFGSFDANGDLQARYGFKVLGSCVKYQKDNFSIDVSADASFSLRLEVNLNPELVGDTTIRISPVAELTGELNDISDENFDLHDFEWVGSYILAGIFGIFVDDLIENYVEDEFLTESAVRPYVNQALADTTADLNAQIVTALGGSSKDYVLPANLTVDQVAGLANIVNSELIGRIPIAVDYIDSNRYDILYNLIVGDRDGLRDILVTAAACQASEYAQSSMSSVSLYRLSGSSCVSADKTSYSGQYYSDAQCSSSVDFSPTSYANYCAEAVDDTNLGNAAVWSSSYPSGETPWTHTPVSRFDIGVASIDSNSQPFLKRVLYRTEPAGENMPLRETDGYPSQEVRDEYYAAYQLSFVNPDPWSNEAQAGRAWIQQLNDEAESIVWQDIGTGSCELEMRIYKKDLADQNLKPMIAIHGGGWIYRGAAYYGMETSISHYTDQGFVVFAPFYRLAGNVDGNTECNNATAEQITSDTEAALDWVLNNGTAYGANEDAPVLLGQSAGAYLSAWLGLERSIDIDRMLLMYPPTDMEDFLALFDDGLYSGSGIGFVEAFMGTDIDLIDRNGSLVYEHSLPSRISVDPNSYPQAYILHGMQDDLVPASQAQRLCNALSGSADSGPAVLDGGTPSQGSYSESYQCLDDSYLTLFAEAGHALDLCIDGLNCPAGGSQSQSAIRSELRKTRYWMQDTIDPAILIPIITNLLLN